MREPARGGEERQAILYTRHGCGPCFAMQRAATHAARRAGISLRIVDVDADREAAERYGTEVPVLLVPGGGVLRGMPASADIAAAFRDAAAGAPRAGTGFAILHRIKTGLSAAFARRHQGRGVRS